MSGDLVAKLDWMLDGQLLADATYTIRTYRHLPQVKALMEANLRDKKMDVAHVNFVAWLVDHHRIGEQV
jgi:hypothetical protein